MALVPAAANDWAVCGVEDWPLEGDRSGDGVATSAYFDSSTEAKFVNFAGHRDGSNRDCSLPNWMV